MWNGFKGDGGNRILLFLAIPIVIYLCFGLSQTSKYNYSLVKSMLNIPLEAPIFTDILYFSFYIIFSWLLFWIIPGKIEQGPINASGARYLYKLNSLNCMIFLIILQLILSIFNILPLEFLSNYYDRIVVASIYVGIVGSIFFYIKGRYFPTFNTSESKGRDDFLEDFFSGIELTPRFNRESPYDLKLFTIGHIGMILWQLFNISHAAYGYNRGSYEALTICILQTTYIVDWAYYERWYLYTIDMQHDRLGFYLGFGGLAYMTAIYNAYGYFTSHVPNFYKWYVHLIAIFLYILGQYLMRASNDQKDKFRKDPKKPIWGKEPKFMYATYKTSDGTVRKNSLLLSGFWGLARHFNYVGDFLECFACSIICGLAYLGAHIYSIQLSVILITRSIRDDTRCSLKYGDDWKKYKNLNPYMFIPRLI